MKLLERTHLRHTAEREAELDHQEVVDRLGVPDDLSGLAEIPSIGKDGYETDAEPHRAATTVRWLRWLPILVLAIAGVVAAAVLLNNESAPSLVIPTVEAPDFATEGPGSNSLTAPWLTQTYVPWSNADQGPGGHSLNLMALPVVQVAPPQIDFSWETHGPGSTSIGTIAAPAAVWSWETHGPGSNSLTAPWLTQTQVPWSNANQGPGGHSLNQSDV